MESDNLLRLAWEADRDGRPKLRDALMTLAVVESQPQDAWAELARARLIARRPYHFLSGFPTVAAASQDPEIIAWALRARVKYPVSRVGWMLLRSKAVRAPFTGRVESLQAMLDDLIGGPAEAENVRADQAQVVRGPIARHRVARPIAAWAGHSSSEWDANENETDPEADDLSKVAHFHLTVLLTIAILLTIIREPARR